MLKNQRAPGLGRCKAPPVQVPKASGFGGQGGPDLKAPVGRVSSIAKSLMDWDSVYIILYLESTSIFED